MKVQVIYSSLSGCTKRVAEAIFAGVEADTKTLHDLKDGAPVLDGDILLLGYWVDKGGPNADMIELMKGIQGKAVGVFCTLGYYADSAHARQSIEAGLNLVKEHNEILGSYVCNGTLSPAMIEGMRKGGSGPHAATPQKELRWEIMREHPTAAECALACERFQERITLFQKCQAQGLEFRSIL